MWWIATGCLINWELYEERKAALADDDADGFVNEDECDDHDAGVNPDAIETCDGVDQDCDGVVDDDATDASPWFPDGDGDGHGELGGEPVLACDPPDGTVAESTDCDDTRADVAPDADEVAYDGVDQDCDGADLTDADGDGYDGGAGPDCDDADAAVHPGAEETWANGLTDDDCDGELEAIAETYGTATWYGRGEGGLAGSHVSGLGDTDGDGSSEWLSAAFYDSGPGEYAGVVYVVQDGIEGALGDEVVLEGRAGWYTGTGLSAGDLDGDSLPEAIVGATGYGDGLGAVFVIPPEGVASGGVLDELAASTYEGTTVGTYAGAQARPIGDLDGDGVSELAVSCPLLDVDVFARGGRVYILSVQPGLHSLDDAAWVWDGDVQEAGLGNWIEPLGDQDEDGYDDVAVSMDRSVAAWILPGGDSSGGPASTRAFAAIYNEEDVLVSAIGSVGDVDGDGRPDLGLATSSLSVYTDITGIPWRGLETSFATVVGADSADITSIVSAGDPDADGLADFFIGVPWGTADESGWIGLVRGEDLEYGAALSESDLLLTARTTRPATGAASSLAVVGDVSGDGASWLAVGVPRDDEGGLDAGGVNLLPVPR